ncbi:helix-turn-helix domain-containing protein [Pelagibacterium sp. 26DY04]|uniref:helix-turn-helix domain-containing protein n=1 Tax=Pelagibacterium sp. 26DY04 TaxID=2967130 RepID=UPI002816757E|nr:helix-turn-helix transcriptional regulator [Pelagibacterium sp. 26DY04]WMT87231.1 helix-turn-helix domain-containing protein [Pelagibacterium sp. 26DY04]
MDQSIDIGMALRSFRIKTRINQDAIARTLGVSQSQVSRWESGRDQPRAANLDAIKALIWGRADPVLAGLIHYVRGAQAPLVLFDAGLEIVAASPFLRERGGPLRLFGWLFDGEINPALAGMARRFAALAKNEPVIALEIPFSHEARPWACHGRLTVNRIGPDLYAIGEMSFTRDERQRVTRIGLRPAARPGAGPSRV